MVLVIFFRGYLVLDPHGASPVVEVARCIGQAARFFTSCHTNVALLMEEVWTKSASGSAAEQEAQAAFPPLQALLFFCETMVVTTEYTLR